MYSDEIVTVNSRFFLKQRICPVNIWGGNACVSKWVYSSWVWPPLIEPFWNWMSTFRWFCMWIILEGEAPRKKPKWTILFKRMLHRMFHFTFVGEMGLGSIIAFPRESSQGTVQRETANSSYIVWTMCLHCRVGPYSHNQRERKIKDSWSLEQIQAGWS